MRMPFAAEGGLANHFDLRCDVADGLSGGDVEFLIVLADLDLAGGWLGSSVVAAGAIRICPGRR